MSNCLRSPFPSSNNSSGKEQRFEKPSHLRRMRSASTTIPINNQIKSNQKSRFHHLSMLRYTQNKKYFQTPLLC
jgi:hypothetical protein